MQILRCDSCGKPLGEGAFGRGDAARRDDFVICSTCLTLETNGRTLPIDPPEGAARRWKRAAGSDSDPITTDIADAETHPLAAECEVEIEGEGSLRGRLTVDESGRRVIVLDSAAPIASARSSQPRLPAAGSLRTAASVGSSQASAKSSARQAKFESDALELPAVARSAKAPPSIPSRRTSPTRRAGADLAALPQDTTIKRGSGVLLTISIIGMVVAGYFAMLAQAENRRWSHAYEEDVAKLGERVNELQRRVEDRPIVPRSNIPDNTGQADPKSAEGSTSPSGVGSARTPASSEPNAPIDLSTFHSEEALLAQPLITKLQSPDAGARLIALRDVIQQRSIGARQAVRECLKSTEDAERELASHALGELRDNSVDTMLTLIQIASQDRSERVRQAAQRSLALLQPDGMPSDLTGWESGELRELLEYGKANGYAASWQRSIEEELKRRDALSASSGEEPGR